MQIQLDRFFDRVLVINSRQRGDRLKDMTERFKELGLVNDHFEFMEKYRFDAIIGGHIDTSHLNISYEKGLNNGEIGCYLSHLQIYNMIIANGWQKTLILEDDAMFIKEFFTSFEYQYNNLPDDFDMWFLGRGNYDPHNLKRSQRELEMYGTIKEVANGLYESKRNWLTHAYVVNGKCAKYLFENASKDMYITIDGVLADLQEELNVYSSNPSIIIQDAKSRSSLR
jgi:GR25 family glycosyltransferase involved in LPS biosynthesis